MLKQKHSLFSGDLLYFPLLIILLCNETGSLETDIL